MERESPALHSHLDEEEKFARGIAQFNSRKFFEAHETWEEIWLVAPPEEKLFLQGLIQVSAAFHHYRRKNWNGARSLLAAGLQKLAAFPAVHREVDLQSFRDAAENWSRSLAADADPGEDELPQITRASRA
ncbi:MAG: DUF309 domain-containing protein [Candidatus Acidiferrales bacterium]